MIQWTSFSLDLTEGSQLIWSEPNYGWRVKTELSLTHTHTYTKNLKVHTSICKPEPINETQVSNIHLGTTSNNPNRLNFYYFDCLFKWKTPPKGQNVTEMSQSHKHWCWCYLGFDVFSGQTLSNDVDALTVTQDVGSAMRVVHQRFDAADQWRVNLRLGAVVVHRLQKIQDARQAVQVDESCDKPANTQQTDESSFRTCKHFRQVWRQTAVDLSLEDTINTGQISTSVCRNAAPNKRPSAAGRSTGISLLLSLVGGPGPDWFLPVLSWWGCWTFSRFIFVVCDLERCVTVVAVPGYV